MEDNGESTLRDEFCIKQVRESDTKVSDMHKLYVLAFVLLKLLLISFVTCCQKGNAFRYPIASYTHTHACKNRERGKKKSHTDQ